MMNDETVKRPREWPHKSQKAQARKTFFRPRGPSWFGSNPVKPGATTSALSVPSVAKNQRSTTDFADFTDFHSHSLGWFGSNPVKPSQIGNNHMIRAIRSIRGQKPEEHHGFHRFHGFPLAQPWVVRVKSSQTQSNREQLHDPCYPFHPWSKTRGAPRISPISRISTRTALVGSGQVQSNPVKPGQAKCGAKKCLFAQHHATSQGFWGCNP
jgi:hypothetical protein